MNGAGRSRPGGRRRGRRCRDPRGFGSSAHPAETTGALDPSPTFWSAPVSDPSDPLYPTGFVSGYDASYFSDGGDGVEFIQVKYSPSGDIRASFVKNMCPISASCSWDYAAHANSRFQGAAGLLRHQP